EALKHPNSIPKTLTQIVFLQEILYVAIGSELPFCKKVYNQGKIQIHELCDTEDREDLRPLCHLLIQDPKVLADSINQGNPFSPIYLSSLLHRCGKHVRRLESPSITVHFLKEHLHLCPNLEGAVIKHIDTKSWLSFTAAIQQSSIPLPATLRQLVIVECPVSE